MRRNIRTFETVVAINLCCRAFGGDVSVQGVRASVVSCAFTGEMLLLAFLGLFLDRKQSKKRTRENDENRPAPEGPDNSADSGAGSVPVPAPVPATVKKKIPRWYYWCCLSALVVTLVVSFLVAFLVIKPDPKPTPSPTAFPTLSPTPPVICQLTEIDKPIIVFARSEGWNGTSYRRFWIQIVKFFEYDPTLFDLHEKVQCGRSQGSRMFADIYSEIGKPPFKHHCALHREFPEVFFIARPQQYELSCIALQDRICGRRNYFSNQIEVSTRPSDKTVRHRFLDSAFDCEQDELDLTVHFAGFRPISDTDLVLHMINITYSDLYRLDSRFSEASDLPPCGYLVNASRTWIEIRESET